MIRRANGVLVGGLLMSVCNCGVRGLVYRLTAVLVLAAAATGLSGCVKNAATGKNIFSIISPEQELAIGAAAQPQFTEQYGGAVPNADLQAYVREVGLTMAAQTEAEYPSLPWEFTFLNSDVINAFALPGGKVFFTKGLASKLSSEAEMAGVIGHEIGHVTAQHGAQRISSSTAIQGGLAVGAVFVDMSGNKTVRQVGTAAIPALAVGGQVVQLKFGRSEELEADRLGMRYMSRVGYDPAAQGSVMKVLQAAGGPNSQPEFLSTHPYPESRIEQVNKLVATEYAGTQNNPQYQLKAEEYRRRMLGKLALLPPAPDAGLARGKAAVPWCSHCREDTLRADGIEGVAAHPGLGAMAMMMYAANR
jgi:predicted Zn-dependent protease